MREISGGVEPHALTQWKLGTPGVGYNDMPSPLRHGVKRALITEQRELCAYTGLRIGTDTSHIEHLIPQDYCEHGEDVAYRNMVACYPGPGVNAPFGAVRKRNWPSPSEQSAFVSPRSTGCEARFAFSLTGSITAASDTDGSAKETIRRLGLDHRALGQYRKDAIDATLEVRGKGPASLDVKSARKRLTQLEQAEANSGRLEPFCFVLKQTLRKHIGRVDAIKQSKASKA
jgi:uncharacterized protein (TIGR02646 family)